MRLGDAGKVIKEKLSGLKEKLPGLKGKVHGLKDSQHLSTLLDKVGFYRIKRRVKTALSWFFRKKIVIDAPPKERTGYRLALLLGKAGSD